MTLAATDDWKAELNDAQLRAVDHDSGPLIVLAGPGTGKTRVIIARLRRLIEDGAEPESLLALTYSVRAAEEMRERLGRAVGARLAERVQARTFHSFGHGILQRFGDVLGLPQARTFIDSAQRKRLLREIIREHRLLAPVAGRGPDAAIARAVKFIDDCRRSARTPQDAAAFSKAWAANLGASEDLSPSEREGEAFQWGLFRDCAKAFELFERACLERGLLCFDHCLSLPLRLFEERPAIAAIVRQQARHIVFDEFQDIDPAQLALLERLAPPRDDSGRSPDLCVVGDDDQAIYGFRGATEHSFRQFAEIWADATTIALTVNYRSGGAIIGAANAHISRCKERFAADKTIEPANGSVPGCVEGVIIDNDAACGSVIGAMIRLDRQRNPERKFSDYAVLARNNDHVQQAASILEALDIPVAIRRKITPLDDASVQDLLAWIMLLVDPEGPGESASVQRLLSRPPFFVPLDSVVAWNEQRRAAMWRAASESGASSAQTFAAWLGEHQANDAGVADFLAALHDLRREAVTATADVVVERIMRRADLVHSEDLTPRERARRVRNLVQALQFVRSRQPYLDQPGDLRSFWRYYNDLDPKERQFSASGYEQLDGNDEAQDALSEAGGEAVLLLTAHSSKGLEFDTVFLLRCRPNGFPPKNKGSASEDDKLPAEFCGRSEPNASDEERRLFYVACTRAKRRLVMLAKRKKGAGTAIDYYNELTFSSPGLTIDQYEGADLLEQAGLDTPDGLDAIARQSDERRRRDALVFKATSDLRRRAVALLRDAANASLSTGDLAVIQAELASAAAETHAIESLRACGELPSELPPQLRERLAPLLGRFQRALAPVSLTPPLKAPLTLSYSQISDYLRCPRCFFVKYQLNLDEPKTTELSVGSTVHVALEKFYKEWREADAEGAPQPGLDRLRELGRLTLRASLPGFAASPEDLIAQIDAQLETCFNRLHDPAAHILEIERKVTFDYPDPQNPQINHRIVAKIDRVDELPTGGFRLIDYKSGMARKYLTEPKSDDLQMCMYRMALPALLDQEDDEEIRGGAEYWVISEGVKGVLDFSAMDLPKARRQIDKAIAGMLAGDFGQGKECKGICWLIAGDASPAPADCDA